MPRDRRGASDDDSLERGLVFALGAAGGLAIGLFLSGQLQAPSAPVREAGARLRERARGVALNLRPGRLRRATREQMELTSLEDAVLDAFLRDEVLSERGIDVGCISRGIVELSGSVRTPGEAERAVRLAGRVEGVETVVNRMDVSGELRGARSIDTESGEDGMAGEWTGRNVGMGSRRQGDETEPGTADDSQHQIEEALDAADRMQIEDEGLGHSQPRMSARPGPGDEPSRTSYSEDELDNQDPYGKHAVPVPEQPQALNSASRVGEGMKPGTELLLEAADVPVKPHGDRPREDREEDR